MSFFKTIWKGDTKHKKLSEEWMLAKSQESELDFVKPVEGVTFRVKMLGNVEVTLPNSEMVTAKAVQSILNMVKVKKIKPKEVNMRISLEGISVTDSVCDTSLLDVSIYRISYCSADASHGNVFAFIATNGDGLLECYAFMCPKRKMSQLISITVAQSFNTAYHLYQLTRKNQDISKDRFAGQVEDFQSISNTTQEENGVLIDLSPVVEHKTLKPSDPWASFEDDNEL